MKTQLYVCIALFISVQGEMTADQKKMTEMLHNNCVKETKVHEDLIVAASKGTFNEDENLKCYMKCLFAQMGVFSDEDNSFDKEAFIEMVPEEIKETTIVALGKCLPVGGSNGCEMAFNLNKCFYMHDPEKYMIV
uniref:Uncharacterized protein n=1 Tax=Homalodisca liturata TaxID=320908 RepID=A0A1B6J3H4_9HEMI